MCQRRCCKAEGHIDPWVALQQHSKNRVYIPFKNDSTPALFGYFRIMLLPGLSLQQNNLKTNARNNSSTSSSSASVVWVCVMKPYTCFPARMDVAGGASGSHRWGSHCCSPVQSSPAALTTIKHPLQGLKEVAAQ